MNEKDDTFAVMVGMTIGVIWMAVIFMILAPNSDQARLDHCKVLGGTHIVQVDNARICLTDQDVVIWGSR